MRSNKQDMTNEEVQELKDSLKVSSYAPAIFDAITTGQSVEKGLVPNYGDPTAQMSGLGNESQSLFSVVDFMPEVEGIEKSAAAMPPVPSKNVFKISKNQTTALKKYPALIDLLGTPKGEELVKEIAAKVNQLSIVQIEANSKEACKYAKSCVSDKQNISCYFVGDNEAWACRVIASGPFRGDEAFYYDQAKDKALILRKKDEDYENVTAEFNVVHEFATK